MFIDDVTLSVKAGDGGNGVVAFRREKYVPMGGPAGGNGGRGGDIIFIGEEGLTTLLDLRYTRIVKAKNGQNGMAKDCFGKDADDVYVKVPIGSVIYDLESKSIIADIVRHKQEVVIAKGGKGGRGNSAFATPRIPAPEICEKGLPGDERQIRIELKVLADVGLVGFPSVGKSTLISAVSAARPKIADYHFTTLNPNLGVVKAKDGRSFVMADLPGLIEGASSGLGLGFQFLKHIERTKVLVHVIDMAATEGRNPYEDYLQINTELETYDPHLLLRPQIIVANKMDIDGASKNLKAFQKKVKDIPIIAISAYTRTNLDELLYKIADVLDFEKQKITEEIFTDKVVEYKFKPQEIPFIIEKSNDGVYNVIGPEIKKMFNITDFNREENAKLFARKLRKLGVDIELRKLGVKHGDTVRILGYEFEFFD
ncbi:MAG: GTPase ObgE [Bacilli bacterium]|jgi:GTP-binding protein|nr:GTPase ObgE [Bacilli bacterium]MDD4056519.1 GTPase ObgE [Bacilli bacterium]MDY0208750.1 GTPase ObgE [Bacilli bacterium]